MANDKKSMFDWNKFVSKPVISSDGKDLGIVDGLEGLEFIVKDSLDDLRYYWIPRDRILDYHDGRVWLAISEEQVKSQFARIIAGYYRNSAPIEMKFLMKIYEETLSRKSIGEKSPILVPISSVASSLGFMTKGTDKQKLFDRIIDTLSEKGLVKRYAASAAAITPEGVRTAKNAPRIR